MDPIDDFYKVHYGKLEEHEGLVQRLTFVEKIINKYSKLRDLRILELGCGTGDNLIKLQHDLDKNLDLYGVDISVQALDRAKEKGINVYRLDLNKEKIPMGDSSIDVILMLEVIEHLYNSDLVMTEIQRTLKSNGILIISTPNLASWANRLSILLGYQPVSLDVSFLRHFGTVIDPSDSNGHIKSFTRRALKMYIEYFGLTIIEEGTTIADGTTGLVLYIDRLFSRFKSLASHTIIAARKE